MLLVSVYKEGETVSFGWLCKRSINVLLERAHTLMFCVAQFCIHFFSDFRLISLVCTLIFITVIVIIAKF